MTGILQKEIEKLKKLILTLTAIVEENLDKAVISLVTRDLALARKIIQGDYVVDEMEVEIEEEGLKILALHQPVAIDLRFIVAVLRINSDLERIGDLAVNLAERASFISSNPRLQVPIDLSKMSQKAQEMLKLAIDALINMDADTAMRVIDMDDIVDEMNRKMFEVIYKRIREVPHKAEVLIHHLSATRHLERVADHATNIAEDVIYMITGEIVRHQAEDFT